jgi:hypothetical protein
VEHGRGPREANHLALACVLIHFLAGAFDEREHFDAMLAATNRPSECAPSVKREDILAWEDLRLRNALGDESLIDRGVVAHGLAGDCSRECFLSDRFTAGTRCLAG